MNTLYVVIGVAGVVLAYFYSLYVGIVQRRNKVLEALGGIDAQLTQRHDLIPNILEIAKSYMEHERGIMGEITALRNQAHGLVGAHGAEDVQKLLTTEGALMGKMGQFFAVAENYPNLKADQTMVEAQNTYRLVEDNLSAARRYYNSAVNDLNNAVQIFPGSMVAAQIGIQAYPFYQAPDENRAPVSAADILRRAS